MTLTFYYIYILFIRFLVLWVTHWLRHRTDDREVAGQISANIPQCNNIGQVVYIPLPSTFEVNTIWH